MNKRRRYKAHRRRKLKKFRRKTGPFGILFPFTRMLDNSGRATRQLERMFGCRVPMGGWGFP